MKGQTPDYRVSTVATDPDTGKDRWTNIGVAFEGNETITVLMDAVPINGKIILQRPRNLKKDE
jgi:hypothetical protein